MGEIRSNLKSKIYLGTCILPTTLLDLSIIPDVPLPVP